MLAQTLRKNSRIFINNHSIYCFSQRGRKKYFFNIKDEPQIKTPIVYPKQYPKNLTDAAPLIPRGRPVRFITPKDDIPEMKMMSNDDAVIRQLYNDEWKSPQNAYSLNVGLIGPVNSGKSQLMSCLGSKVSSVSPKRNTTDQILHAVRSLEVDHQEGVRNVQLKYYDTPGLMHHKTGYLSKGWKVLNDIDFSLLIIDSSKKFDDLLQESINRLEKHKRYEIFMKALVLNKIDLVENKRKFHGLIAEVQKYGKFDKIFYTSALTGYGVQEIQDYLVTMAKKRQWQYPKQAKTDSSEHQIVEQLFKQALFHRTYNQVPYQTLFECQSIARKSNGVHFVQFRVMVDCQSVQKMIIGKKGRNINWMRDYFKASYAKHFGVEVQIHVRVVIRKKRIMREMQQIQKSYYEKETKMEMKLLRDKFEQEGKLLK